MSDKILVTGADGFIGSHLVERLATEGRDVRAFVYYNSFGHKGWLDEAAKEIQDAVEFFPGDVRDPNGVREAMKGCGVVLNLAALIGIPFSYHSPDSYVDTNIKGALNLLQAARDAGVRRFVQVSTSEVYGAAKFVPISEDHPLQGRSPYAATKIAADQLALSFYRSFATPVTVIRPFNVFGPRQSARAVIPTIITQALSGRKKIKLGSLHPTRDYTFVADTVAAMVQAAATSAVSDDVLGEVINVGCNFEISIGDIAQMIGEIIGVKMEIEVEDARKRPRDSEVERLWADNAKAARLLGWTPALAGKEGFREGLIRTIDWFREPGNLKRYDPGNYTI